MPRVRYGQVHIYNNYYNSATSNYHIGIGFECHVRLENTHFDHIDDPWADYGGTENGEIGWAGLKFDGCSQPTFMPNAFPVFEPPYDFTLDPVDDVKAIVEAGAGNVFSSTTDINLKGGNASPAEKIAVYMGTDHTLLVAGHGEGAQLTLYNCLGQALKVKDILPGRQSIDISQFSSGIYFVDVKGKHSRIRRKIVKK
jgi:hypothetical protein